MKFNYTQILPPHQKAFKKLLKNLDKNFKVNVEDDAIRAFGNNKELWFKYNIKGEVRRCSIYNFSTKRFTPFDKYEDALQFLSEKEIKKVKILEKKDSGMLSLF